jgi:glucose-6-phosphate 1-dehydrogenase
MTARPVASAVGAPTPAANPLRAGLRLERAPEPCVVVIFGATGDLTNRKVLPALYNLRRVGLLPPQAAIVGFARRPLGDDAFRAEMRKAIEEHSRVPIESALWDDMAAGISYVQGEFHDPAAYRRLAEHVEQVDTARGTRGNRLMYLATPPSICAEIVANIGRGGLDAEGRGKGWARVVIEKPFGSDLASARQLNRDVGRVFRESQVYRIDHYLGKETVRNLLVFRFGNGIFEPIWNRRYVDHVQITVAESLGVGSRGTFYEEAGATRDILQNHALQLLGLTAMEPPIAFEADDLRNEKLRVIKAVEAWTGERIARDVVRGQYGPGWVGGESVRGYREEANVASDSVRETYVALRLEVQNWRWADVPFYLRVGKRMPRQATEIAVQFKRPPLSLFRDPRFREANIDPEANLLALRIQPDEGILLRFVAKVPGLGLDVRSVNMDFTYGSTFSSDAPEAYETLLLDVMLGDASLFTRADEVEAAWEIVTPIESAWASAGNAATPGFPNYAAGTWGPPEADSLMERDGRRWRRP